MQPLVSFDIKVHDYYNDRDAKKIQYCWILAIRALRKESERLRRGEARHPGKAHLVLPRRLTSGEPQFKALSISC